jgi:tripartite-type tricarboxylate transporter receptor subunit TctC
MITSRRSTLLATLGTAGSSAAAVLGRSAGAQQGDTAAGYPSRPIRLIAPYPPGGGVDTTARLLGAAMGTQLGQPIVVENRGGAAGAVGAAEFARAAPDGYTLMVDATGHVVNPVVLRNLSFDYATAFTPISQVVLFPLILVVNPATPVRTLDEFVAYVRARPGQLSYGSSGNLASNHLSTALWLRRAGLEAVHVPYRGGPLSLQDLLAGNIAFSFANVAGAMALVQDGKLRVLGVATAARLARLPEVPTIAEQGFPGYEFNEWNGLFAPAGTPAAIIARLYEVARRALAEPAVRQRLDAIGAVPLGTEPAAFAAWLAEQRALMARLVQEEGIRVE